MADSAFVTFMAVASEDMIANSATKTIARRKLKWTRLQVWQTVVFFASAVISQISLVPLNSIIVGHGFRFVHLIIVSFACLLKVGHCLIDTQLVYFAFHGRCPIWVMGGHWLSSILLIGGQCAFCVIIVHFAYSCLFVFGLLILVDYCPTIPDACH